VRHVARGGSCLRVADPAWRDPLSPNHARRHGGRWNSPNAFGVTYLNASRPVARAQVRHKLEPRGIRPEDLAPSTGPVLVRTKVPDDRYVDAVTDRGLASLGLPASYPLAPDGAVVSYELCRPIGLRAQESGERGIACRSAAQTAPSDGEELAYFGPRRLRVESVERFADWYWSDD
jgi:RES domain